MSENGQFRSGTGARLRTMSISTASSIPAVATALPDPRVCEQARLSRDPRFDGLFFTAVTSTGIYCRPVCPAPTPRRENITYYASAAAAETAGFRPCLRCRPELAPHSDILRRGDTLVARALQMIDAGELEECSLAQLAQRLALSDRQLRRLFVERLGAAPLAVHTTRRLLFAKQLLSETDLPITQIALASGFRSLRRFNAAFQDAYRLAPRDLRKRPRAAPRETLVLRLGYRPPYDLAALLDFLRTRALPGLEAVDADSYARAFGDAKSAGWLRVSAWGGNEHALRLELHGAAPTQLLGLVAKVRRLFDLDADPSQIHATLAADPTLHPMLQRHPGLRLPGAWDGFELSVRAVLGQQVSVAAARTLALRLLQRHGVALPQPLGPELHLLFPAAATIANADLDGLGMTGARIATLRAIASALLAGEVDFSPERTLDEFVARWTALPGIGAWTAHYIALRALSHPDAFPADDLILRRAAAAPGETLGAKALTARAEAWRPWRGYAVMHLWRSTSDQETSK
jgi:AraC family transcriptional regulator, regulatory protein of adaptative response / DNA-3-methyladenine glycosylase II